MEPMGSHALPFGLQSLKAPGPGEMLAVQTPFKCSQNLLKTLSPKLPPTLITVTLNVLYVCMYVRMYACMHACMHACMRVCMYAFADVQCSLRGGKPWDYAAGTVIALEAVKPQA